jgi:hypothetical protein
VSSHERVEFAASHSPNLLAYLGDLELASTNEVLQSFLTNAEGDRSLSFRQEFVLCYGLIFHGFLFWLGVWFLC